MRSIRRLLTIWIIRYRLRISVVVLPQPSGHETVGTNVKELEMLNSGSDAFVHSGAKQA
jgi:hypothetical protein